LRVSERLPAVAGQQSLSLPDAQTRLAGARAGLFAAREKRVRPGRDDKVLTAWNALAIAGLARASRALDHPRWAELAFDAADALRRTAWRDGRLLATRHGERADLNAYLDDYAFLLAALMELMQTRFRAADFAWAHELAEALLAHFEDRERGGFFFTSHDHERLFHRTKPGHDNATPSGNGVAARALIEFGHLAGEVRYLDAAERTLKLFAPSLAESPAGHATLIEALALLAEPPTIVLLRGDAEQCVQWQRTLESRYRPRVRVVSLAGAGNLPAALQKAPEPAAGAVASVCHASACLPPMASLDAVLAALEDRLDR
jgi:uncharacterized protein